MATNKNQHYVPRCYLKEFTSESAGKAINVYNIDIKKLIPSAPVKNQCSKDYFYGQDVDLENAIQFLEGSYASALKEILSQPKKCTEKQKAVLRKFILFQYLRTESASKRAVQLSDSLINGVGINPEEFKLNIKDAVIMAMKLYAEIIQVIDDLKICLIHNKSKYPFITSDDPAVLTNKWHLLDERTKHRGFGLNTAGLMFLLPLSSEIFCLAYDGDVYSVPNTNGWISTSDKNDIISLNQFQILNCRSNLFIKDANYETFLRNSVDDIIKQKPLTRHIIHYAIPDGITDNHERYKVVDYNTAQQNGKTLMHLKTIFSQPKIWPSFIKLRPRGRVYTNGTGIGYIRESMIKKHQGQFQREPVVLKKKRYA